MADEYVLLDSYPTPHEAHLAANTLRAVGIPVRIADEAAVGTMPHLELALGGVKVFVPESDVEDAVRILRGDVDLVSQPYREPGPAEDLDEVSDDLADSSTRTIEDTASRALRASIFGLFLCPVLLQAYSISLLLKLPTNVRAVSPRSSTRARASWAINVAVLVLAAVAFAAHLSR